ncbi:MAG TPA: MBG domain-containing protein, partial [Chloroflexia bacterium]|nr:MBG domain-containing protein [Chloroflexia bacterium]
TLTGSIVGVKNDDAISASYSTTATNATGVGSYAIVPAAVDSNPAKLSNYAVTLINGTLTIAKAVLTVTADNKSRIYGDANPAFTASYSGFKNGETLASSGVSGDPALATPAVATSNVGTHPITAALGGLSAGNYSFSFAPGTLTITKALLTVTADNKVRVYGQPNPAFTASYGGFKNSETLGNSGVTGAPSLSTSAVSTSNTGTYPIIAAQGNLSAGNYEFTFVNGTLTVTPQALQIGVAPSTMLLGATTPMTFTAVYTGFTNGDTAGSLGGTLIFTTPANASSAIGAYPVTPSGLTSTNYAITFVTGTIRVIYRFDGFLQPINDTAHTQTCGTPCPLSIFKAGSTVPVRFQLKRADGTLVQTASPPIWMTPVDAGLVSAPVSEPVFSDPASSGTTYQYLGQQYQYNWRTANNQANHYWRIGALLDDGQTLFVYIALR